MSGRGFDYWHIYCVYRLRSLSGIMSLCVAKAVESLWRSLDLGLRSGPWQTLEFDAVFGIIMVTFLPHMVTWVARDLRSGHSPPPSDRAWVAGIPKHQGGPDKGTECSHPQVGVKAEYALQIGGPRVVVSSISAKAALAARVARPWEIADALSARSKNTIPPRNGSAFLWGQTQSKEKEMRGVGSRAAGQLAAHQQLFAEIPFPPSHN